MNTTETTSDWRSWTGSETCPNCNGSEIEYNIGLILTSYPPRFQLKCKSCGHIFNSEYEPLDQISDWNPVPQVEDWSPSDNYGWICPKCGRCLAPHIDSCPCFNEATLPKFTY